MVRQEAQKCPSCGHYPMESKESSEGDYRFILHSCPKCMELLEEPITKPEEKERVLFI